VKRIMCVGTLIVDIINSKVERLPNEGESIAASVSVNPGGNTYSMSVNLKRLNPKNVEVYCCGITGEDDLGEIFKRRLIEEDIISFFQETKEKNTSCNVILQEIGRDRRYIFDQGANSLFSKDKLLEAIHTVKPDVIAFGEIPSIGISGKDFLDIAGSLRTHYNSLVLLDLLVNPDEPYEWLQGNWNKIDVVHYNYGEGVQITKKHSIPDMVKWFIGNEVKLAIISDGANGCCYGFNNEIVHIEAYRAEEMDATGAGDAMVAGIITRLLEIQSSNRENQLLSIEKNAMKEIIAFGSACGAVAVQSLGCISDISRHKVEAMMKKKRGHFFLKTTKNICSLQLMKKII